MTHEPIRKALMAVLVLPGVDDATRDVKELAAAALADLDRVTRERDEALTVLADARGTIVELCESFGVPKPLATLGRIDAALGDVGV